MSEVAAQRVRCCRLTAERHIRYAAQEFRANRRISWVAVIFSTEAGRADLVVRYARLPLLRRKTTTGDVH